MTFECIEKAAAPGERGSLHLPARANDSRKNLFLGPHGGAVSRLIKAQGAHNRKLSSRAGLRQGTVIADEVVSMTLETPTHTRAAIGEREFGELRAKILEQRS
jgi:hypothetical protein